MIKGILKKHSIFFITLFRIVDPAIVILCTYIFYSNDWFTTGYITRKLGIYCSILVIIVFPVFRLYRSWRIKSIGQEIRALACAWTIVIVLSNFLISIDCIENYSLIFNLHGPSELRALCVWAIATFISIVFLRLIVRFMLRYIRKKGWNQRHVVIAGTEDIGLQLAKYLQETDFLGIEVNGFFDDKSDKGTWIDPGTGKKIPVMGKIEDAVEYSVANDVDIVLIALPVKDEKKINALVWRLGLGGINVMIALDFFSFGLQKTRIINIGDLPVMLFNIFPVWKRFFDIIFSFFSLIFFLPFMLIIMILIKREDGGSIFYGHERIREHGRSFKCLKFRTMHIDADKKLNELLKNNPELAREWEGSYKLKNDPRITKIGKFLRRTSLDELPQLINVLKGEMSIVGVRPIVKDELDKFYNSYALEYCSMKPGLTGLWQVGKRNDIENYAERIRLDRSYILNVNIWLDLKIILKTIWKMVSCKGAY